MVKNSTNNFESIQKTLQTLDFFAGSLALQENKKKTWKEWAPVVFLIAEYVLLYVFAYGTIMQHQLVLYIVEVLLKMIFNCAYITLLILNCNKTKVMKLIDWCKKMYDPENYSLMFGESTYKIAKKHIYKAYKRTTLMLKWSPIIIHANTAIATLGVGVIALFLPETIHKRYNLPVPFYLPFKNQETWLHYGITVVAQCGSGISLSAVVTLDFGVFMCVVLHIFSYLDTVHSIVGVIKQELEAGEKTQKELEDCSKIVTEMMTEVVEIATILGSLYSTFCLLIEMSAFGSMVMAGLIFLVVHQQRAIAVSILLATVLCYIFCFLSEKLDEKFSDIADTLYDIPWYALPPNQRKIVLRTMMCGAVQIKFKASGFHYVTLERFLDIVKAAYSNCIVLKDLLTN